MNVVFKISVILAIIGFFLLPLSVRAQSEILSDPVLEQELEWVKAEAKATTVKIATKTEMTLNEAPSIVSVITAEEIRNSGAKTLEEVLRQIAGFYIYKRVVFPETILSIRGFSEPSNAGIKIMINGHAMENVVNENNGVANSVPVDLIKKIEIIRGPGSALYGNEAMSGVINIITRDGKDKSFVSSAYGSFDMYKGTVSLSYAEDDLNLFVFGSIFPDCKIFSFSGDGDPQYIEKDGTANSFPLGFSSAPGYTNEDFTYHTFFTRLSYKGLWLTGYYQKDKTEPPVGITSALTDENEVLMEKAFAELGYESSVTEKIKITGRMYYDYVCDDFLYEMFSEETSAFFGFPQGESMFIAVDTEADKFGAEIMTEITPADNLEIVAGISYEHMALYNAETDTNTNFTGTSLELDGIPYKPMQYLGGMRDNPYPTIDKASRTVFAGYVQGTWDIMKTFPHLEKIGENFTLTAGLRYDKYDDVGDTLNPRMGLVYAPDEKLFFKLLYGEAFRAPVFTQMYLKNNPAVFGNPNMEPETIKTSEILAGINLTKHITATLDFFHIKKENNILLYQGRHENWGKLESQGIEGELRISYDKNRYGFFNVTFQKAEDLSHEKITDSSGTEYVQEDFNLGMYPEVIANMGVNWDISKYINANVSVNYIGSVKRVGKMQFTPDEDGIVEKIDKRESLDSYTLVNLSLRFGNFDFAPGWEFQLTGYNIFDADHRDPEADGAVENDLPRWDRHFMGKLTYTF